MKRKQIAHLMVILGFLLGIRDGFITLWHSGQTEPLAVFPYRAEFLPDADRKALEQGIPINDEQQLNRLLEDYLS